MDRSHCIVRWAKSSNTFKVVYKNWSKCNLCSANGTSNVPTTNEKTALSFPYSPLICSNYTGRSYSRNEVLIDEEAVYTSFTYSTTHLRRRLRTGICLKKKNIIEFRFSWPLRRNHGTHTFLSKYKKRKYDRKIDFTFSYCVIIYIRIQNWRKNQKCMHSNW